MNNPQGGYELVDSVEVEHPSFGYEEDEPPAEPIEIVEVTPDAIAVDGADDEPAEDDDD